MVESKLISVLLVGEGNFSYALARARHFVSTLKPQDGKLHLIATSFDSEEELHLKYPETTQILTKLKDLSNSEPNLLQVNIFHRVDATKISETLPLSFTQKPNEITFCHPHIGHEDLQRNSSLVAHFLNSAKQLNPNLIQITLLEAQF